MTKKLLITGGAGYVGSRLVPYLIEKGFDITVIDTLWFGNHLVPHKRLKILKEDIRNISNLDLPNIDAVIHLANIANDPAVDLSPVLSWETNVLAGYKLIEKSVKIGAKHFIFASSGSVYGIKSEDKVTEDLDLVPLSAYNKTKMIAERVFKSFSDQVVVHNIRPATVCGYSPRMRLDVAVNLLTMQAIDKGEITVLGGDQRRPNIHINDMIRVYEHFLENPDIPPGEYNAGFQNISIMEIAQMIQKKTGAKINMKPSNDPRSYNQCSDLLVSTGFQPRFDVKFGINEIIEKYKNGELIDDENWHTVKKMKQLKLS